MKKKLPIGIDNFEKILEYKHAEKFLFDRNGRRISKTRF